MFADLQDKLDEIVDQVKAAKHDFQTKRAAKLKADAAGKRKQARAAKPVHKKGWKFWAKDFGAELDCLKGHKSCVSSVCFAPDMSFLATSSYDHRVKVWTAQRSKKPGHEQWKCTQTFKDHDAEVICIAVDPESKLIASASWDTTLKLWSKKRSRLGGSGESSSSSSNLALFGVKCRTFSGHTRRVLCVAFTSDSKYLASGDWGASVKVWSVQSGTCVHAYSGHKGMIMSVRFSPNGSHFLATAGADQKVKIWHMKKKKEYCSWDEHMGAVCAVAFSPDTLLTIDKTMVDGWLAKCEKMNGKVLTGAGDMRIKIWCLNTKLCLHTMERHTGWVLSVAWSPDGNLLASADDDHMLLVWDATSRNVIRKDEDGHKGIIQSIQFSSDSSLLVTAAWDGAVKLWMGTARDTYLKCWNKRFPPIISATATDAVPESMEDVKMATDYRKMMKNSSIMQGSQIAAAMQDRLDTLRNQK